MASKAPDKILLIPAPREVNREDGQLATVVAFADFVRGLLSNPVWVTSYESVKAAKQIEDAVVGATVSVTLPADAWQRLRECVVQPRHVSFAGQVQDGFPMQGWVMRQLLPFCDAILNAEDESPEV